MVQMIDSEVLDFLNDRKLVCLIGRELAQARDSRAMYWLRKAYDLKDPDAPIWMAWCFANGIGCEKNFGMVAQYYDKAISIDAFSTFSEVKESALIQLIYESGERSYSLPEDHYSRIRDYLPHCVRRGSASAMEMISGFYDLTGKYDDFFDLLFEVGLGNETAVHYLKKIYDKVSDDRKAKLPSHDCPGQRMLPGCEDVKSFW